MNETYDEKGLTGILDESLARRPEATAIALSNDGKISFQQLSSAVESFSRQLVAAGVAPGDVVAMAMPNSLQFVIAFLAITSIRATAAPLNPAYTEQEFSFFLEDQGAVAVLDDADDGANATARLSAHALNLPVWEADLQGGAVELSLAGSTPLRDPIAPTPVAPDDVALLVHTSGSTSRPKGVPLSHANLLASIGNIVHTYEFTDDDRSVLVMPLFHVHGLMAGLLAPLAAGASVLIPVSGKFSASTFWRDMVNFNATWYTAVPTIHQILLARYATDYPKEAPPTLRFIRSCSAALAPAVLHELEERFGAPVLEAYAMTEVAHQMTSNPLPKHGPHKPGSVGTGQGVEVVVRDAAGNAAVPRETGEIWVRGANVMKGYRNNPEANQASFDGDWFDTGDQGYLDEDGYLFITGRTKEIINRGGEKISPGRIDEVLLAHPGVSVAVAFGTPDSKYGEEVHAAIILKPDARVTADDLTAFCLQHLSSFAVPKRFFFVDSLPMTSTGKIQRKRVAEHFLDGQ
jgi:acyl-CoA synthetase (AMP-forming)/AMP-acid ligase II